MTDAEVWADFLGGVQRQRGRVDGMIPLGLILVRQCREAHHDHADDDGGTNIDIDGPVMILWPPGLTRAEKADLLSRAASILTKEPSR